MVRVLLVVVAALAAGVGEAVPAGLPRVSFQDQEGRTLDLRALEGRVIVIVYGGRTGMKEHVRWGTRLDRELRSRGVYLASDPAPSRPVRILALAQMGGIPSAFREVLRAAIRPHVEPDQSLWLDWEDRMSALFGVHDPLSTVVVIDRAGVVRAVVSGPPEGAPYRAVSDLLRRLR